MEDSRHFVLTDTQVKKALLNLFKEEIRKAYDVQSFALVSTGTFIVKLAKRTPNIDKA
jgi:hypothetical protein